MSFDLPYRPLARLTLLCVLAGLACGMAGAQEPRRIKKVDLVLYAADSTIRSLDIVSTHALLASPCKCFYETDPMAPGSRDVLPQAAFHYGMTAAVIVGHRMLERHHHARLARLLIVADLVSETWAVQNNFRQEEPRLRAGMVGAGRVASAGAFRK